MLLVYIKCNYKLLGVKTSKNQNIYKYSQMPNTECRGGWWIAFEKIPKPPCPKKEKVIETQPYTLCTKHQGKNIKWTN